METRLNDALRLLELAQQTSDRAEAMHLIARARAIYPISKETVTRIWASIVPGDSRNAAEYWNLRTARERIESAGL